MKTSRKREFLFIIFGLLMIAFLLILPTGYEDAVIYQEAVRCKVRVLSTDESSVISSGLIQSGEQICNVEVLDGRFKGRELRGVNMLSGSLESDKIFKIGDKALVVISVDGEGNPTNTTMSDYYRLDKELILAGIYICVLIIVAGFNGVRAIFSFIISMLLIWKMLVPMYLNGYNPIIVGLLVTTFLTVMIIYFVWGIDIKSLSAIMGSLLGTLVTCVMGMIFTGIFKIHGAIMTNSESLLYAGYQQLNLTAIFMSSIVIGSCGAMMDLAVDITSAVNEVVEKKPDIGWREAFISGMNVGRAAMGTMTTTLLLAYSGGYIALLMVFMAQGTPVMHILNYKYVASEVLDTVVGSFGLVTVAPFTALVSSVLLTKKRS
ncbi:MAG: YibE/F family protein [Lachnospiraceae bacterium]